MNKRVSYFLMACGLVVILSYVLFFSAFYGGIKTDIRLSPPNTAGTCTDDDGGIYPSTKGIVVSDNFNYGQSITITDYCLNSSDAVDYSCDAGNTYKQDVFACKYGCNNGACVNERYSYFLSAQNFFKIAGVPVVSIINVVTNTTICLNKEAGQSCDVGVTNFNITELYITDNGGHRAANFSRDFGGRPFGAIFDNLGNRIYLPLESDLPVSTYQISVVEKDGGSIQDYDLSWQNGQIIINQSALAQHQIHNFVFDAVDGNKLRVRVPMTDGNAEIYLLYGDGARFTGIGKDNTNKLAVSYERSFVYNRTDGDEWFALYWSRLGFNKTCEANVIANSTECLPSERRDIYYKATADCRVGLPPNQTAERCDYNRNRIIGFVSDIRSNFNVSLYENDNLANLSRNFSGVKTMSLNERGDVRVEFDFDFDDSVLDLTGIELEKQNSSHDFGYLIVNGLDARKIFYIDIVMNNSNAVCVKDSNVADIDDIRDDCSRRGEYAVLCDGRTYGNNFTCTESGGDYKITGLRNSGVREFEYLSQGGSACVPSWSCSEFSQCSGGLQTRLCVDLNSCNTNSGKPAESQMCSPASGTQACSELGGEICPADKECSIGTASSSDGECCLGVCKEESRASSEAYFWVIVVILTLAIIAVIVIIFLSFRKRALEKSVEEFDVK